MSCVLGEPKHKKMDSLNSHAQACDAPNRDYHKTRSSHIHDDLRQKNGLSLSLGSTWSGQTSLCGSSWGKRARGEHEVFTKETLIITWSLPKVPTSFTPFKSGEILIQCNTLLYKDTNWISRSNRDPRAQIAYRFTLKFEVSLLQERGWRHADEQRNYETVSSLYKVKVSLRLIEA